MVLTYRRSNPCSRKARRDYRHILPIELLSDPAGIDVSDPRMSQALRRSLRNQNRMWSIDPVGSDVDALLASIEASRLA